MQTHLRKWRNNLAESIPDEHLVIRRKNIA